MPCQKISFQAFLLLLVLLEPFPPVPVIASSLQRKDEMPNLPLTAPDNEIKCGECPCVNPCSHPPPPPPPSPKASSCNPKSLAPPPPRFIYFTAVPPPPPRFIYVTGVPGQLYTTDADNWGFYSAAPRNIVAKGLLLSSGMLLLLCGGIF